MKPATARNPARERGRIGAALLIAIGVAAAGAGCGGGSGTAPANGVSGTLEVSGCEVAADASSCLTTIRWTTNGATAPRLQLGTAVLSTTAAGSTAPQLGVGVTTVQLFDGAVRLDEKEIRIGCVAASASDGSTCRAFAQRQVVRAPTPFTDNGAAVTLEVVLYRPLGAGPFPAVLFHHGSTGNGDDPSLFRITYTHEAIARFFADRGWLTAFAQRRGRGASDGVYDEGLTPDRSRYSCVQAQTLPGVERALQDLDAVLGFIKGRSEVDGARLLSAGTSRGGILAVAHAGQRAADFKGAINFVGGWLGEGCADAAVVNRTTFLRGAAFPAPTLWLYANNDSFYSVAHSRANFDAFAAAGGTGSLEVFTRAAGLNGHFVVNDPALWTDALDAYLRTLAD